LHRPTLGPLYCLDPTTRMGYPRTAAPPIGRLKRRHVEAPACLGRYRGFSLQMANIILLFFRK